MNIKSLAIPVLFIGIGGCALSPPVPISEPVAVQQLWHDQAFSYDPLLVTIDRHRLFALDGELRAMLDKVHLEKATVQARVNRLIALLYGPRQGMRAAEFPYAMGHSSIAAETWRRKKGDCLSLLVLAYSIAKYLDLPAHMQEVRVPPVFDRYGGVDYVAGHVNLLIKNGGRLPWGNDIGFGMGDIIIDFEPQFGSQRSGSSLGEDAILARFYNNLAAEYMAEGNYGLAYAHFKAAILTDADFAPAYANLAVLYRRQGLQADAERLLRLAISKNDQDDVAMGALHEILVAQGRDAEATAYARVLDARREKNPYYWIGVGLDQFGRQNYSQSIAAFERASDLSTGFEEIHRYLAIAYLRNGNKDKARRQAALLANIAQDDPALRALNAKLKKQTGGNGN